MKLLILMGLVCLTVCGRDDPATVLRVHDGDSIEAEVDLGLGVRRREYGGDTSAHPRR